MTHDITDADARSALTNIETRRRQIVATILSDSSLPMDLWHNTCCRAGTARGS